MIDETSTLPDVCFEVSAALDAHAMSGVLVGGSAATVYAPQTYTSYDADFILDADDPLQAIAVALGSTGFERDGGYVNSRIERCVVVPVQRAPKPSTSNS